MDDVRLARWRLHVLRLNASSYPTVVDAVGGMLGVQAENYPQATWALASRTADDLDPDTFQGWFDEGRFLRTHVLRPTWHFVLPEDIGWLIELTGPRIQRSINQIRRELGLDDHELESGVEIVEELVSDGSSKTRTEIGAHLASHGLDVHSQLVGMIIMQAETEAVVCSGPIVDGELTYASLPMRAPQTPSKEREEAIAEIVLRYFTGHGPATERDLSYWASMTLTDVRLGLAQVEDRLSRFEHHGRTYWYSHPEPESSETQPRAHILQTLDEYHNGFQDSRRVLDAAGIVPRGRPKNVGMVLVDSQMVGGMRRHLRPNRVTFEVNLFRSLEPDEQKVLADAASRYAAFLEREPELTFK